VTGAGTQVPGPPGPSAHDDYYYTPYGRSGAARSEEVKVDGSA
jgi:hypothetical protein